MPVSDKDVLLINAVFMNLSLLRDLTQIQTWADNINGAEIVPLQPNEVSTETQSWQLRRDRIILETSPQRTTLSKEYPSSIDDIETFALLTARAIEKTKLRQEEIPTAFGFNIHIVYNQQSNKTAIEYLGQRILDSAEDLQENWRFFGGFGTFFFVEDFKTWKLTLEPRFSDYNTSRVFLEINLHIGQPRLPNKDEIVSLMTELWNKSHSLIRTMDDRNLGQ